MNLPLNSLAMFGLPGGMEWIIIAILGLLLFGKRLPEVGKSLGQSIVEFKKGLQGVEREVNQSIEHDQKEMLPPPQNRSNETAQSESQSNKVS